MTFQQFSNYLAKLESTSARLEMTAELSRLWPQLTEEEIRIVAYLLQGVLLPSYISLEFQLSTKMVLRALGRLEAEASSKVGQVVVAPSLFGDVSETSDTTSESLAAEVLTQRYKTLGDVGLIAAEIVAAHHQSLTTELTIEEVYVQLVAIANTSGGGSQDRKLEQLTHLFKQLSPQAAKFVARIVIGKMRLGFSTMTMIDSLSWAKWQDKRDSELIEMTYQQKADIGKLAASYLRADFNSDAYQVEVGVPLVPALCQRLNTAAEIIEKMGTVYAEPKYDGLRIQIHVNKAGIIETDLLGQPTGRRPQYKAFTRNLEDVSDMFPELATLVSELACDNCIIDSEAIGIDPVTKKLVSFQTTITRKRKHDVAETAVNVPIKFFVFDLMWLDQKSLIVEPLHTRKKLLANICAQTTVAEVTVHITTDQPEVLRAFHEQQLAEGLEGAVMKQVDSEYRSGRKGWRWVKIKEHEGASGKLSDTIDCVVMGYYKGRGKRTGFGVGAFLLGVVTQEEGEWVVKTLAKLGTGLTDADFPVLKTLIDPHQASTMPPNYRVDKTLLPDVWVEPKVVLEIAADEITKSPTHQAGLSLRFPRLIKIRSDKSWQQATSIEELQTINIAR